jgi:hypothetical protein
MYGTLAIASQTETQWVIRSRYYQLPIFIYEIYTMNTGRQ